MSYILVETYVCYKYNPPQFFPEGTYVCKAKFLNPTVQNSIWCNDLPATLPVMI